MACIGNIFTGNGVCAPLLHKESPYNRVARIALVAITLGGIALAIVGSYYLTPAAVKWAIGGSVVSFVAFGILQWKSYNAKLYFPNMCNDTSATINDPKLFWNNVEKTKSSYLPGDPIIINGKQLAEKAEDSRNKMFRACSAVERYVVEYFEAPPKQVLDLGAGIGANTRPMAKNGSHVTAIDISRELLQTFSGQSVKDSCPTKNIRLRLGDITTMSSYGTDFDLVVAVDILPYIAPKDLRSTMEKIKKCLTSKGVLIGTIFTTDLHPTMRTFMGKMGANFYEGDANFVSQLLTNSGFSAGKIEEREEGGFRFKAVKITTEEESS